jgi:hypothetical protein
MSCDQRSRPSLRVDCAKRIDGGLPIGRGEIPGYDLELAARFVPARERESVQRLLVALCVERLQRARLGVLRCFGLRRDTKRDPIAPMRLKLNRARRGFAPPAL